MDSSPGAVRPELVLLERPEQGVALLRLNRPAVLNALNMRLREALAEHVRRLDECADTRVIVLTGNGTAFAAGADLNELAEASVLEIQQRGVERHWQALAACRKPLIAAVEGHALGGGCELAMHCDLIVAGASARFAQPEVRVGVMPGAGGTQRLVRAVGKFQALRMLFTGCTVRAPEALAIGLVSEVAADGQALDRALEQGSGPGRRRPAAGPGPGAGAQGLPVAVRQPRPEGGHACLPGKTHSGVPGKMSEPSIVLIGIVGTGAMGQGIAQLAACAGLSVLLYDSRQGVALQAREQIATVLARQVERGRLEAEAVERAMGNLRVVEDLRVLRGCQLVIEAIVENLEAKQALFRQLEEVVGDEAILASNTSSLSVTAIASACRDPGRVAGLHFFNPVPLMRLVEVIEGLATRTGIAERLCALVATFGHQAVRATDSPGFIVNHAGRAFGTEALRILGEGVAPVAAIDEVLREGAGFRMGPFELFDLVGLDVSLPVMESIYRQYYEEPRYRPHPLLRQMLAAGRLGRKSGQGFYRYDGAGQVPVAAPAVAPGAALPPVWLGVDDEHDRAPLLTLLQRLGAEVESGERPSGAALCLLAPLGADVSAAARRFAVDPTRSLAIDVLSDLERHRCLMACPATRAELQQAARTLFARDGVGVTLIRDSAGFIVQRTLASIVNLACDIAQQGIASVEHIDLAVRLGLGYPLGPLEWGDRMGAGRVLRILERLHALSGDPRYRPSPWLRRRAQLGLSLRQPDSPLAS